jgi:hypothetical protein
MGHTNYLFNLAGSKNSGGDHILRILSRQILASRSARDSYHAKTRLRVLPNLFDAAVFAKLVRNKFSFPTDHWSEGYASGR